jgi:hypothetical protein
LAWAVAASAYRHGSIERTCALNEKGLFLPCALPGLWRRAAGQQCVSIDLRLAGVDSGRRSQVTEIRGMQRVRTPSRYFGLDAIAVDLHRNRQTPIEYSPPALAPMHAHAFRIGDLFPAGDPDGVILGLDIEIILVHARDLKNGDQCVALLEDMDAQK